MGVENEYARGEMPCHKKHSLISEHYDTIRYDTIRYDTIRYEAETWWSNSYYAVGSLRTAMSLATAHRCGMWSAQALGSLGTQIRLGLTFTPTRATQLEL